MIFSLDLLGARKGDCFLLHFGTQEKTSLIMVDGGPKTVYAKFLKPRLKQIRAARNLNPQDPLTVNLLMVSHVDDDHIQGILDLTKEAIEAADAHQPKMIEVMSFWHNSFDAILNKDASDLDNTLKKNFQSAVTGGQLTDDDKESIENHFVQMHQDEDAESNLESVSSSLMVLASIEQGYRLRSDAKRLNYRPNPEFNGKLIIANPNNEAVTVAPGLKFTVLGPMKPEIGALRKRHQEWLESLANINKTAQESLAAYVDSSIPNLSSIVVLAESDGKYMLLTGDARGDKVLEGLQLTGLLEPGKNSRIAVDLLKVPHHGSANNLDTDFFHRVIAKHYVFSGNGEHGNPERESLGMLLAARGNDDYEIHLTYDLDMIDKERQLDWEKERKKEINRNAKTVTPAWSAQAHSLRAFLDANPDFAKKFRYVEDGKAHVIDLAEQFELSS